MQLVPLQKSTAQALVNIFETGSIRGNYADVTLMAGDTGQLTYGRSQTTLASGNLYLLINDYCARPDGALSTALAPFLPQLLARDPKLNHHAEFRRLLHDAGSDPVMQEVQDIFFDRVYWAPAMRSAEALGVESALGCAIVYDSTVHGSFAAMRDRTRQKYGELGKIGEKHWMARYLQVRRDWLANASNALLHKTVYRMDALKALVDADNWDLELAVLVRGCQISPQSFSGDAVPVKAAAEGDARRLLWLTDPPMKGADVDWLQQRLPRAGYDVEASGAFDAATDAAVRRFQASEGLTVDGVVGPVTRSALEDLSVTVPLKIATQDVPMPAVPVLLESEPEPEAVQPEQAVVSQPMVITAPKTLPRSGGIHPAHPLPPVHPASSHPAPSHPAPARPAPQSDTVDNAQVDEIKRHISEEVQAGLKSLRDAVLKGGDASVVLGTLRTKAISDAPDMLRKAISNGRPLLATFTSLAVLVVTESRDALVWNERAPAQTHPAPPEILHSLPQTGDIAGYAIKSFQALHSWAAQLPPDWTFRLRIGALALIGYATYRLIVRRYQAKKIVETVADSK